MADLHRAASRSTVPSEAFDFTHPDHEEWVGADNDRCLAPDCALHHEQSKAREVAGAKPHPDVAETTDQPHMSVCFRCGLVLFDGLHRNGYRECVMVEVETS